MEKKEIQKPLILEMDEAKIEIIQVINKAIQVRKLPLYILDMVLSEIGSQIKEGAKQELNMARQQVEAKNNEEVA